MMKLSAALMSLSVLALSPLKSKVIDIQVKTPSEISEEKCQVRHSENRDIKQDTDPRKISIKQLSKTTGGLAIESEKK